MSDSAKTDNLVLRPNQIGSLSITRPDTLGYLNFLIYGDSGVGKTNLAASASEVPDMFPVLIMDAEAGTLSIRNRYPNVDVVKVAHFGNLVEIHDGITSGKLPYKTIIIDSITEVAKIGMDDIMFRAVQTAREKDGSERDPDLPGIGEWGKSSNQVRKFVRFYKSLPCHVIMTALAKVDRSRPSNIKTKPDLPGQLADSLPGQVDEVFYMYVKDVPVNEGSEELEQKRFIVTGPHGGIIAKDRSDLLPKVMTNPTMKQIIDSMNERTENV